MEVRSTSRELFQRAQAVARVEQIRAQAVLDQAKQDMFALTKLEEEDKLQWLSRPDLAVGRAMYWQKRRDDVWAKALKDAGTIYPAGAGVF